MPTGISGIDKRLGGLQGITVLQGEPAACKSTLCLQIANNVATQGHPVFIIDCENGLQRLRIRTICQLNKVTQPEVLACSEEQDSLWGRQLSNLPIFSMTHVPKEGAHEIVVNYIKELYSQYQKPVLLVADSLQSLPKLSEDPRINIDEWLKFFDSVKLMAEGLVYILITSEKKRGTYNDAFKDGAKGSGTIEYKAEIVLDLRRNESARTIVLACTKNRDGLDNFQVDFEKVLTNPDDEASFCFLLEEMLGELV